MRLALLSCCLILDLQGVEHVIRGLGSMPKAARETFIYLIVGRPADCGQPCLDYRSKIEQLADELGVKQQVLIITEHLSEVRCG
jgi:hypothetical protein